MIFNCPYLSLIHKKFDKISICLIVLLFFAISVNAQNDSLQVESLYKLGLKNLRITPKTASLNFEKALKIINENILTKDANNRHFLLRKALILDQLSYDYRKDRDYILSLKSIQESIKIKESIGETFTLPNTYRVFGGLYQHKKDSTKAIHLYNKAMKLAKTYNNTKEIAYLLSLYARHYYIYKDIKMGRKYAQEAYDYSDSIGYNRGKAFALNFLSSYERYKKNYTEVIKYSKQDLELSKASNDRIGMERGFKSLGYAYRKLKQPKKAIYYYEKSLELVQEMEVEGLLANRYLSLSNAHSDLKQHEIAFSYYRLYKRQQIKDLNIKSIKEFAELDAKYTYDRQKTIDSLQIIEKQKIKEAKILEEASTRFWKLSTVMITVLGLAFTTIFFILRRKREQVKLGKLQNEILQKEINYKKKDLKHLALDITNNKEWALILAKQLDNVKSATGKKRANELIKLESEIKNKIKVDETTEDFHNKIEVLSSSFYEKLKNDFPNLTKNDIRLCSLLRLNMDTKQIATLQNINPSSVKMNRNRLRKKLNLLPSNDLQEFLNNY